MGMVAGMWVEELLHLMVDRKQRKREGLGTSITFQDPNDLLLPADPTS
jgi:hypothetical protein